MSRLFYQIIGAITIVFRLLRAYIVRFFTKFAARIKTMTNIPRKAAKAVPQAISSVAVAGQKPTKREDYIETQRLYISKAFIVISVIVLIAAVLLFYFLLWPLLQRTFFTARLYVDDVRVPEYSGKVIIYYDKEKKSPMFSGRYKDGLAQGPGMAYDENGLLKYSGDYLDGMLSGKGKLFEDGVLLYDGDFYEGVFHGAGTLYDSGGMRYEGEFSGGEFNGHGALYTNGRISYQGTFAFGEYNGEGTLYDADGIPLYKGSFAEGFRSGSGTEYYSNGAVKYRGTFFEDLYDESGRLFDDNEALIYEGGFRAGRYQGEGTLFIGSDRSISAAFEDGEPKGNVNIYSSGRIYYSGLTEKLLPHGFGSYFAQSSPEILFQGLFRYGTLDGSALIGLPQDEARSHFLESGYKETRSSGNGFSVVYPRCGVTLYFNLKTEASDPAVLRVYWYVYQTDSFEKLPWKTAGEYEVWRFENGLGAPDTAASGYDVIEGDTPFGDDRYYKTTYGSSGETISLWSAQPGGDIFLVEWVSIAEQPDMQTPDGTAASGSAGATGSSGVGAAGSGGSGTGVDDTFTGRTESLLGRLGIYKDTFISVEIPCKYYGGSRDISGLLSGIPESEIVIVLEAAADFLENAERREAYEQIRDIRTGQLARVLEAAYMGADNDRVVDVLKSEISSLDLLISRCTIGMERARLIAFDITGRELKNYDLQLALFIADPAEFDLYTLLDAAVEYNPEISAITLEIMSLELAYQELVKAGDDYTAARAEVDRVRADYEIGKAEKDELENVVIAGIEIRASLYSRLAACSRGMVDLNTLTGDWLVTKYRFYDDVFRNAPPEPEPEPEPEFGLEQEEESGSEPESNPEPDNDSGADQVSESGEESEPGEESESDKVSDPEPELGIRVR